MHLLKSIKQTPINANLLRFYSSRSISVIGDKFHYLALIALAYRIRGSAFDVSMMLFCRTVPGLLLYPVAGVLGDRINRKLLLIFTDVIRGLVILLIPFASATWQVYALVFVVSAIGVQFSPTSGAFLPMLTDVEHLRSANAGLHGLMQVAGFIGPVLGGLVISRVGFRWAFICDSVSFFISALLLASITTSAKTSSLRRVRNLWADISDGLKMTFSRPRFRRIALSNVFFFWGPGVVNVLLYVFVVRQLSLADSFNGWMTSSVAVGVILGSVLATRLRRLDTEQLYLCGIFVCGVGLIGLAVIKLPVLSLLFMFVIGIGNALFNIFTVTIVQQHIPSDYHSRSFAFLNTVSSVANLLMLATIGKLGDVFLPSSIFLFAGCASSIYACTLMLAARRRDAQFIAGDQTC